MNVVTFGFHPLTGNLYGRFAITVSRNWRLTFAFEGQDPSISIWRIIMVARDRNRPPVHPGEILREDMLPGLGLPVSTAAKKLGVTRQAFHRVLAGTAAFSLEMALRVGKFCGNGPEVWLRMQGAYDLWYANRSLAPALAAIETQTAA